MSEPTPAPTLPAPREILRYLNLGEITADRDEGLLIGDGTVEWKREISPGHPKGSGIFRRRELVYYPADVEALLDMWQNRYEEAASATANAANQREAERQRAEKVEAELASLRESKAVVEKERDDWIDTAKIWQGRANGITDNVAKEPTGTTNCDICGRDTPHSHDDYEVDLERRCRPAFRKWYDTACKHHQLRGLYKIDGWGLESSFERLHHGSPEDYRNAKVESLWNVWKMAWFKGQQFPNIIISQLRESKPLPDEARSYIDSYASYLEEDCGPAGEVEGKKVRAYLTSTSEQPGEKTGYEAAAHWRDKFRQAEADLAAAKARVALLLIETIPFLPDGHSVRQQVIEATRCDFLAGDSQQPPAEQAGAGEQVEHEANRNLQDIQPAPAAPCGPPPNMPEEPDSHPFVDAPSAPLVTLTDVQKLLLSWGSPMTDREATQDTIRQVVALAEAVEQLQKGKL